MPAVAYWSRSASVCWELLWCVVLFTGVHSSGANQAGRAPGCYAGPAVSAESEGAQLGGRAYRIAA